VIGTLRRITFSLGTDMNINQFLFDENIISFFLKDIFYLDRLNTYILLRDQILDN